MCASMPYGRKQQVFEAVHRQNGTDMITISPKSIKCQIYVRAIGGKDCPQTERKERKDCCSKDADYLVALTCQAAIESCKRSKDVGNFGILEEGESLLVVVAVERPRDCQ